MPKILIVSTSSDKMGDHPTGTWLEEVAAPYNLFTAAGHETHIASTKGGEIPVDAGSKGEGFYTEDCKTFEADATAMNLFKNSLALDTLAGSITEYDAVYFAGGHGTCADFPDNPTVISIVETMYAAGKVVGVDCHGVLAVTNCVKPNGEPLVKGLQVTAFTDAEETAVGLHEKVPFLVETKMKELGADFCAGPDWGVNVCVAGKLVTGQNPQSSAKCAQRSKIVGLRGGTVISRTDILRGQSWAVANSDTSRSTRGGAVQAGYFHQRKELDKKDSAEACWSACSLSGLPLREPVTACWLGRLYNKKEFGHLKTMKDFFDVHLTPLKTDELLDAGAEATQFCCPVLHLRAGAPAVGFRALPACSHVISERALRQIAERACPLCSVAFTDDDVIPLYGNAEQVADLKLRLTSRPKLKAKNKRAKEHSTEQDDRDGVRKKPKANTESTR
ncbi:hypothetical protein CYMTET_11649 [Cymbomonas tetramitiformis]|uniref:DJ-1/PfpI domain-containing protein n=1 Tax=Cymbomonas tetramitiformis TaxID=36881 RepID=A0AAE0C3X9_9CHLO|nr:hypothetical protein CYMTET_43182 [Cymbomonas tetramitiformis]KAK3280510.1 hypothetical protein CYMTET_11649 [Cymbomonas tetramitiformis]